MEKTFCLIQSSLVGYSDEAVQELHDTLEAEGFAYRTPRRGGGGPSPLEHFIAWLNIRAVPRDVLIGVLLDQVLVRLRKWRRDYQSKDNIDSPPIVRLFIYPSEGERTSVVDLEVEREYTQEELNQVLDEVED